ncbi:hypothetical protein BDV24DRAFT_106422 [Aspergillus arachidicola]|uniref:Uncharacterized protein n=1 Tax=Aspergillus arachidicola TaxID=656916 RepID=A0A5N6XUU1_9EURO|nr:hypothetical protein BDV24DRAFT_106422 [Aspergillus arachidicola]
MEGIPNLWCGMLGERHVSSCTYCKGCLHFFYFFSFSVFISPLHIYLDSVMLLFRVGNMHSEETSIISSFDGIERFKGDLCPINYNRSVPVF